MWCGAGKGGRDRLKSDSDCSGLKEEIRILLVGAPGVGKTALCQFFATDSPVGNDGQIRNSDTGICGVYEKWDTVDGDTCYITLVDVNIDTNEESVNNSTRPFLQNSDGVLLVYSVTDKGSLRAIESVLRIIQQVKNSRGTPVVLVGNKIDLRGLREVRTSDGREFAFNIGSSFYEISTKYGRHDVNSVFYDVIRQIRCVRYRARVQEKACVNVSGLIRRLSLKSRRRHFKRQSSAT